MVRIVSILFFSICALVSFSNKVVYNGETVSNFGKQVQLYSSEENDLQYHEIKEFNSIGTEVINLGVSNQVHWLRFDFSNKTEESLIFNIPFPVIDEVDMFLLNEENKIVDSLISGVLRPFSNRKVDYQDYALIINQSIKNGTVVIRVKSGSQILLPMTLANHREMGSIFFRKDLLMGMFMGVFLIMFFYNLFIYFSTQDKNYRFYLIYLVTIAYAQFTLNGYAYKYLTPESPSLSGYQVYIAGIASGLGVLFFVIQFLHLKERLPLFRKIIYGFALLYVLAFILMVLGQFQLTYNIINFCASIGSIVVLIGSIKVARQGYRPAKFFTLAWSFFLFTVILFVLKDVNVLPYNNFTVYSMPFGAAIEVVLLALALADKINILQEENRLSRERELQVLLENKKLITEQNILLEKKVAERTSDLKEALDTLKNAQSQLVSQEKMASLGQLTAGIAHEINNPINFVSSNVAPLRRDFEDLKGLVDKYDELTEEERYTELRAIIDKYKNEIEYTYLLEEIQQLLDGIQDGASRTAEIVKSLKNFSRLDEVVSKFADIHEGIESTLVILKSGIKSNIKVDIQTEFDPRIQPIECYPGKLNQVFSNVIVNAIQAMSEDENTTSPKILISTKDLGDNLSISIMDNGPGMPDEVKSKIFEPFFTTKEVGEGTGLGLSIVFSIIESHHGTIDVNSTLGEGTEFLITIPKALN